MWQIFGLYLKIMAVSEIQHCASYSTNLQLKFTQTNTEILHQIIPNRRYELSTTFLMYCNNIKSKRILFASKPFFRTWALMKLQWRIVFFFFKLFLITTKRTGISNDKSIKTVLIRNRSFDSGFQLLRVSFFLIFLKWQQLIHETFSSISMAINEMVWKPAADSSNRFSDFSTFSGFNLTVVI